MVQHPLEKFRKTAIQAAKAAGTLQLDYFDTSLHVDRLLVHDLKLEIDRLCEQVILNVIRTDFPDHDILAEERGVVENNSEYVWIIDPLDGTVNFYNRIAHFCCCIACYYRGNGSTSGYNGSSQTGEPLLGVVYAPVMNELFVGVAGGGATCNDKPIRVRPNPKLCEIVVGVSFGSTEPVMQSMERITSQLVRRCHKVRVLGSCGLDIVNVACGRLGALVQRGVRLWDFAASRIILEEAGGTFDAVEFDKEQWDILACLPEIAGSLREITHFV